MYEIQQINRMPFFFSDLTFVASAFDIVYIT